MSDVLWIAEQAVALPVAIALWWVVVSDAALRKREEEKRGE